ncbi:lipoate--protein ligase family protein [bacterium]|nr:lipoate--protein ligase family protein [bacterium]
MKLLDLSFASPYQTIACDEALLLQREEDGGGPILRFWETETTFVVLGRSNKTELEVNVGACRELQVPIVRRTSGGGSVINGPGCLNYTLILPIDPNGPLAKIDRTYLYVLERHQAVLQDMGAGTVQIQGISDLSINGRKFSGNAQRRKRRYVLFHGTFLLNFDIGSIMRLLPMPSKQPDYRAQRQHAEFLMNLKTEASKLKENLIQVWDANEPLETVPHDRIKELASMQFSQDDWTFQF